MKHVGVAYSAIDDVSRGCVECKLGVDAATWTATRTTDWINNHVFPAFWCWFVIIVLWDLITIKQIGITLWLNDFSFCTIEGYFLRGHIVLIYRSSFIFSHLML